MGAWGVNTFDNDTACDWAAELRDANDLAFAEETLNRILDAGEEYLDSDDATMGLAACEVIARLKGHWGVRDAYTEALDAWIVEHPAMPSEALTAKAAAVVDRVLAPESELVDLWRDSESFDAWREAVADLRGRVQG